MSDKSIELPEYISKEEFVKALHIETGFYSWDYTLRGIPIDQYDQLEAGLKHRREIQFKKSFVNPPLVYIAFQQIDTNSPSANTRVVTRAENVTSSGFVVCVDSWADTKLFSFAVQWIAFESNSNSAVHFDR